MKNLRSLVVATLAVLGVLANAPSTWASFISGTISGEVTSAGGSVPGITVGGPVVGSYTYDDSTTVNDNPFIVNPLTAFSLTIGTNSQVLSLADLVNGGSSVPGRIPANSTPTADSLFFFFTFPVISSYVGATVSQQNIGLSPIPQQFTVTSTDPAHSFSFAFTATPAVPEPSTLTLFGIGCVALAGCGWRSRKRVRG